MPQRNTPQFRYEQEQAQPYLGEYSRLAEQFLKKRGTPVYSVGQGLAELGIDLGQAYFMKKGLQKEAAKEGKDFSDYAMAQKLAMDPGLAKDPRSGALYSQADFNGLQTQGVDPMNTQQRYAAAVNALAGVNPRMAAAGSQNLMQAAKMAEPARPQYQNVDGLGLVEIPAEGGAPKVALAPPPKVEPPKRYEVGGNLVDENGKVVYSAPKQASALTPVEVYQKNFGPLAPGMMPEVVDGKVTPKQIPQPNGPKDPAVIEQARVAALKEEAPAQRQSLATALQFYDNVIGTIDKIEKNPDTKDVVGSLQGMSLFPNKLGGDNAQAASDITALNDMLQVQGLQIMRDASKTGGAVGSITEREWPKLSSRFGNLSTTQKEGEFGKTLGTIKRDFKESRQRIIDAYNNAYGQFGGKYEDAKAGGATGRWGDDIESLLNKYDPPR